MNPQESLFAPGQFDTLIAKVDRLSPDTQPVWGTMTAAQMLAHCATIQEVMNGTVPLKTPFILRLMKGAIRRAVIKGAYKKNGATHPQYKQHGDKDFDAEKARLVAAMRSFVEAGEATAETIPHPLFGKMSSYEKGRALYKHLEHHFRQFDVWDV